MTKRNTVQYDYVHTVHIHNVHTVHIHTAYYCISMTKSQEMLELSELTLDEKDKTFKVFKGN